VGISQYAYFSSVTNLLSLFFRTAHKTTKAIRQGWTKVKGVSGEEECISLGIHRGGGAANRQNAYGSAVKPSTSGASSRRTSSRRPSTAYVGNGLTSKEMETVTALAKVNRPPQPTQPPSSKNVFPPIQLPITNNHSGQLAIKKSFFYFFCQ
jgi:hypothetical protein